MPGAFRIFAFREEPTKLLDCKLVSSQAAEAKDERSIRISYTAVKKDPSGVTYPYAMRGVLNAKPGFPS
jgi:hypothetical protein